MKHASRFTLLAVFLLVDSASLVFGAAPEATPGATCTVVTTTPLRSMVPFISPDGRHLTIWRSGQNGAAVLYTDDQPGPSSPMIRGNGLFSPDSKHVAIAIVSDANGRGWVHVYLDNKPGPEYTEIGDNRSRLFSPDSKHFAYVAQRDDEKWVEVLDGKESQPFGDEPTNLLFSPDSNHLMYYTFSGAVIDGKIQNFGAAMDMAFSPDSQHSAYFAFKGGNYQAVLDGKPVGAPFAAPDANHMWLSTDLTRSAHVAGSAGKMQMVIDDKPGPTYVEVDNLTFSPDSKHVAYTAKTDAGEIVVLDGQPQPDLSQLPPGNPGWVPPQSDQIIGFGASNVLNFSPDSKHLAYGATIVKAHPANIDPRMIERYQTVVQDGKPGLPFTRVAITQMGGFSPDSQHFVYIGESDTDRTTTLVFDGKAGPAFDKIRYESLVFSPDSRRFAYVADNGDRAGTMVCDGKQTNYDELTSPTFSATNQLVYSARTGDDWHVYIDGNPGPAFHGIDPDINISPDGKHVLYYATLNNFKRVAVLDGHAGPVFDDVLGRPPQLTFDPDGSTQYFAAKDQMIYKVVQTAK